MLQRLAAALVVAALLAAPGAGTVAEVAGDEAASAGAAADVVADGDADGADDAGGGADGAGDDRRCTDDGSLCISAARYVEDVCTAIESQAGENGLDPNFLARLLWKESLFEPGAISPKGAQGIAQFMPGTARIVGLDDPFNPAKAIRASAGYLRRLTEGFGNIGLAAVAYNGGEARAARFIGGADQLPWETQDYVLAITGLDAWKWRDEPPAEAPDLRLEGREAAADEAKVGEAAFRDSCVKLAGNRSLKEFVTPARAWPWGVILASHPRQSGAAAQVARLNRQLRPLLGGRRVEYVRKRMRGMPRPVFTAQVGWDSRAEAARFCLRLRQAGGNCIVLKN